VSGLGNPLVRQGEDRWPEARAGRRGARRVYDTLAWGLAGRSLPGALTALDRMGRVLAATRVQGPSPAEVGALYDWLPPGRCARVARDISALRMKNRAAIAIVERGGLDRLATLVQWPSPRAVRDLFDGGAVVAACHVGAFFGIRAAVRQSGRQALVLADLPMSGVAARTAALKRAIDWVRDGGLVVATLDGPGGTSTDEVDCLGRRIVLRRGPFVLARVTGAPLVPLVCAWTPGAGIEMRVSAAILRPTDDEAQGPAAFEATMAARTAAWMDAYLRAEPQEIWLYTLRNYLASPRVPSS
jgi:hypothetical protein